MTRSALADKIISAIGIVGCIVIVGLACMDVGREIGRREATALYLADPCPGVTTIVYPDGTRKCHYQCRPRMDYDATELRRMARARERMK
jgi:hypothetical protein